MENITKIDSAVCIAGAHRSGTSMLTRLLHAAGLMLGSESDLMPARPDNPDGFWENLRFVDLNEQLLTHFGGAWDLPPPAVADFSQPGLAPLKSRAESLIAEFEDQAVWGWKDPRSCLTMPFWKGVLPGLKTIVIVRSPLEVAYSLRKRNGTSHAFGLRIWEIYNRRVIEATDSRDRLLTHYDFFFEHPKSELERIAAFIGLPQNEVGKAAALVAKNRRHTHFTVEQMAAVGVGAEVLDIYRTLTAEALGRATTFNRDASFGAVADIASDHESLSRSIGTTAPELLPGTISQISESGPEREMNRRDVALDTVSRERDSALRERDSYQEELAKVRERFLQTNHLLREKSIGLGHAESRNAELTRQLRQQLQTTKRLVRWLSDVGGAAERLRNSRRWKFSNPAAWLKSVTRHKPLPGFGHLDKVTNKFNEWHSSHPELGTLDDAIHALGAGKSFDPKASENGAESLKIPPAPAGPIDFPVYDRVEASIIIPVFNQCQFTLACLDSIQQHCVGINYEVIVIDDCSTDESAATLRNIPGLVFVQNAGNKGFVFSCNRGAQEARGDYLVFLNNDTTVTRGWLSALRDTFNEEPRAGLVGSKLVYPDGRLQEAGGIIWRDGSGWNRGKFQDAARPEYNYLKEVDYCSAASVMISKDLFVSLGGFDEKYAPAYYEDADLAFKIRAAGRKVLYQPLSTVIHYEGVSSGTDTSAGAKKHQVSNRATFATAWETVLADKPVNGDVTALEASHPGEKRILVIDHHLPMTDRDAGSVRMFHILTLLRDLGHKVTFLPDNLGDIPPYGDDIRKCGIEFVHHPYCKSVRSYLEEHGQSLDVVILSRCDFARKYIAATRQYAPQSWIIFDTVDLHHLRLGREAELTKDPRIEATVAEKARQEFKLIDEADETWVVSHYEQQLLKAKRPHSLIEVVPTIVEVPGSKTPFSLRHDFLFIGGFQHSPNADAVLHFAQEVFPSILQQFPGIRFYVIGDKAPPSVIALASENIIITGLQPDVRPYFESVRLSVAPLRFGAGVKGKINQSMSFGVPVVATSLAVEGMSLTDGVDIVLADSPDEFAQAVIRLYEDAHLWEKLSQNGLRTTASAYSPQAVRKQLSRLLSGDHLSHDKSQNPAAAESVHAQGLEPGVAA